jgi:iron complex outermembrane recepter protein
MKTIKTIRIKKSPLMCTKKMHVLYSVALILTITATPAMVFADARTDARRYFNKGMSAIRAGAYLEGAELLLKAYKMKPHPNVLYNVAKAYVGIGDLEGAIEYFEKYVKAKPSARAKIDRVLRDLRAAQRIRALVDRSSRAIDAGRYQEGTDLLQTAYNLRPRAPLLLRLARAQTMAHQLEDALSNYEAYLASRPDERKKIKAEIRELENIRSQIKQGKEGRRTPIGHKAVDAKQVAQMVVQLLRGQNQSEASIASGMSNKSEYLSTTATASAQALEAKDGAVFEEVIVTASRRAQSPLDAPNAVTVITEEDIRLSGARSIPDLMRRVPGMDVMAMSYADWNVAARGFNRRIANKLLILVDGRTAYEDFLGGMLWLGQSHQLEDIARIEVVRGPGSAIYGANAYAGIINIILKRPSEIEGSSAMLGGGNGSVLRTYFQHAERNGALGFRGSVGFEQGNKYEYEIDPNRVDYTASEVGSVNTLDRSVSMIRADSQLEYDLPKLDGRVFVGGGLASGYAEFYGVSALRNQNNDGVVSNIRMGFESPSFSLLMFWNSLNTVTSPQFFRTGLSDLGSQVHANLFSIEPVLRPSFTLGGEHSMVLGAEYRHKLIDWNYLEGAHSEPFYAFFIQDSWAVSPQFTVLASYRLDRHPLVGVIEQSDVGFPGSPRLAFIYKPFKGQAFRASLGTAFRAPTQAETYLDLAASSPVAGVAINLVGGKGSLQPEDIVTSELGYLYQGEQGEFEAVAYINRINNLITRSSLVPTGIEQEFSAQVGGFIGAQSFYQNEDRVFLAAGSEISARFFPFDGFDLGATYAYQYIIDLETNERFTDSPRHKASLWTQVRTRLGLDMGVSLHFVSEQDWIEPDFDPDDPSGFRLDPLRVDSSVVVIGRLGYRFLEDRMELAVSGTNLLDYGEQGHKEHPFANRVETRLFGSLTARF